MRETRNACSSSLPASGARGSLPAVSSREELRVRRDAGDRRVDLVGEPGREAAERREPLLLAPAAARG